MNAIAMTPTLAAKLIAAFGPGTHVGDSWDPEYLCGYYRIVAQAELACARSHSPDAEGLSVETCMTKLLEVERQSSNRPAARVAQIAFAVEQVLREEEAEGDG